MDHNAVKEANRRLYDAAAKDYEAIDGRRSLLLALWLKRNMETIRSKAPGGSILDLGSGSGFLLRCCEGIFEERVALDISQKILALHRGSYDLGVCADTDHLPFADNSFDVVSCFAVLHHIFSYEKMIKEIFRVLKRGGILYIDHDMDKNFFRLFGPLVGLYRRIRNAGKKYSGANSAITEEIYRLSEVHENGIDSDRLVEILKSAGFSIKISYHWYGLSRLTDLIFGFSLWPRGFAPIVAIRAVKG